MPDLVDESRRAQTFDAAGVSDPSSLEDLHIDGLDYDGHRHGHQGRSDNPAGHRSDATIAVDRDGTSQRLLPRVVPVPGLDAQQSGAILLLYDVTDLARLDEMRSELVAVASHELQTPLTTLQDDAADAAGGGGRVARAGA